MGSCKLGRPETRGLNGSALQNPMNRVNRGNHIHGVFVNVSQPGCFNPGRSMCGTVLR